MADRNDVSRREALVLLGVTSAAAVAGGVLLRSETATPTTAAAAPAPAAPVPHAEPGGLPLRDGAPLARWTLTNVGDLVAGAVGVSVAAEDGRRFDLEVLARDESPTAARAPGESKFFSVYAKNHGNGDVGTVEEHGLAAMALATVIERNETRELAKSFLTLAERQARYSDQLGKPGTVPA